MYKFETFLRFLYDMELDNEIPGLSDQLKKTPRAYEVGFNYWFEHRILGKPREADEDNDRE